MNNINGTTNGYIEEDIDDETSSSPNDCSAKHIINEKKLNELNNDFKNADNITLDDSNQTNQSKDEDAKQDQEFIFIHDTGFNVKIAATGLEPFEIQVIF